jgi:L-2,4-diaminobutyrate decarboxylase
MNPHALRSALDDDREHGCVPIMIAATTGTTNTGMIEHLVDCANLARAANTWYHVDAAWGGALIVTPVYAISSMESSLLTQ